MHCTSPESITQVAAIVPIATTDLMAVRDDRRYLVTKLKDDAGSGSFAEQKFELLRA
jgi:hypothetical protein